MGISDKRINNKGSDDSDDETDDEDLKPKLKKTANRISKSNKVHKSQKKPTPHTKKVKISQSKFVKNYNSEIKKVNHQIDRLVKGKKSRKYGRKGKSKSSYIKEITTILKESEELSKILQQQASDYVQEKSKKQKNKLNKTKTKKANEFTQSISSHPTIPSSLSRFNNILQQIKGERQQATPYFQQQQQPNNYYYSDPTRSYTTAPYYQQLGNANQAYASASSSNTENYNRQSYFYQSVEGSPGSSYLPESSQPPSVPVEASVDPPTALQYKLWYIRTCPIYHPATTNLYYWTDTSVYKSTK